MILKLDIADYKKVGRLGNNLFQIATGIGQSTFNDIILPKGKWPYEIYFPNLTYATLDELTFILSKHIQRHIVEKLPGGQYHGPFPSDKYVNYHLDGHFQTEKYFKHKESIVRNRLQFASFLTEDCTKIFAALTSNAKRVTGIHVRTGNDPEDRARFDYSIEKQESFYPIPTAEYFKQGMEILKNKTDCFLIVGDDTDWCRANLQASNTVFSEQQAIVDLCMLSFCSNFILSNSSFSWWGAWLSKSKEKDVYLPKKLWGPANANMIVETDYVPKEWRRL
jgi:hypothetical protein